MHLNKKSHTTRSFIFPRFRAARCSLSPLTSPQQAKEPRKEATLGAECRIAGVESIRRISISDLTLCSLKTEFLTQVREAPQTS